MCSAGVEAGFQVQVDTARLCLEDVLVFAERASGICLRGYQRPVAQAIVDSVLNHRGLTFVVMFPRQSGKNELQAQVEAYLLMVFSAAEAEMVKVSPTWKPQSLNAMRRLERTLGKNWIAKGLWVKEQGYIFRSGGARMFFLSGSPTANIVGATASTLLECDEAQDVLPDKWDKEVAPMAASTNATQVFWGTAWTSRTLLARELRAAEEAEKKDGIQRVFRLTADDVRREVEAYGRFVDAQVAKLGRNHPFVRTQFFSEEVDAEGGMFPPERCVLMQGTHAMQSHPLPGRLYAMLVDVAGGDEDNLQGAAINPLRPDSGEASGRDSTAMTVVEVDLSLLGDPLIAAPRYLVVYRRTWTNVGQAGLYAALRAAVDFWGPWRVVVDATGIGAGLASFLAKAFPEKVRPFVFSQASKSKLAWDFLAVIEGGRYKEYQCVDVGFELNCDSLLRLFWQQCAATQFDVQPGPQRLVRWGVPDGTRDAGSGELVHDDLVLSAALCAVLDAEPWGVGESVVVEGEDVMDGMREVW